MEFAAKQEVVKINIVPDHEASLEMHTPLPVLQAAPSRFDNSKVCSRYKFLSRYAFA